MRNETPADWKKGRLQKAEDEREADKQTNGKTNGETFGMLGATNSVVASFAIARQRHLRPSQQGLMRPLSRASGVGQTRKVHNAKGNGKTLPEGKQQAR
ncbi:unnamed protein product [Toxocara canis]|uniref:Phage protein n=1 Tax=Toxocara canis TaxID=6265 RepID=A0A183UC17_TOXCA|nr:unnamed protein product [Toxocara canis]